MTWFFFFKQKTAYEMRISDWSSDVCSSDLRQIQQELGDSGNAPARPHFADWMVREGFVKDRAEAFRKWLGAGKLGDVKQHWPTLEETVQTLRTAGAWVSLAHPWHYDFTRSKRRRQNGRAHV